MPGLLPAAAGVAGALLTWQRWFLPFVDGSRELAVPARIAAGERLYRDVVWHYGPLAPWVNGTALKIFGVRLAALEIAGLLAAAVLGVALGRLTREAGGALSAASALAFAAAICVGAPNGGSFLFPYAFASLYALAAGFVALAAASGAPSPVRTALAAVALGAALASKPEIGAAAAAVLLAAQLRRPESLAVRRGLALALAGGVLLGAVAWWAALAGVPLAELSPEGPLVLFSPPEAWRGVYRVISGLADPKASLSSVATALFLDLAILGAAFLASRGLAPAGRRLAAAEAAFFTLVALGVALAATPWGAALEDRLPPLLSPMPIVAVLAAVLAWRGPAGVVARARFLLFGFSALVGLRVLLGLTYGYRTTPYSVLALPGLAAVAAVLVFESLAPRAGRPDAFRRCAAAVFAALALAGLLRLARIDRAVPAVPVESRLGTTRLARAQASVVAETLRYLAHRARPGDTLTAWPEAGFFSIAAGMPNPLRQEQILPGHLDEAGEERIVARIREAGPRFFLLVNQRHPGWGPVSFGRDFARAVFVEIERQYDLVAAVGAPLETPLGSPHFFLRVYERRAEP